MKINTNSNVYTLVYASAVVIIVAFVLAFVSKALEPASLQNERIDKKKQILASLNIRGLSNSEVESAYDKSVTYDLIIRTDGSTNRDGSGKDKDAFRMESKDIDDNHLPLYQCYVDGQTKYVIPLYGKGLWGSIWGYIALNDDKNTVFGAYFSHQSETAGLGARIKEESFQQEFVGKKLFADDGAQVQLGVVKKKNAARASFECDAISGATLTCNGVTDMIHECIAKYSAFLLDK